MKTNRRSYHGKDETEMKTYTSRCEHRFGTSDIVIETLNNETREMSRTCVEFGVKSLRHLPEDVRDACHTAYSRRQRGSCRAIFADHNEPISTP